MGQHLRVQFPPGKLSLVSSGHLSAIEAFV